MTAEAEKAVNPIPEGFHTLTPYLAVRGADKLMEFMKQAFGAEEIMHVNAPSGALMHAELRIADSMVELGDPEDRAAPAPAAIHLYVKDADAVYKRAIEAGATSTAEPVNQPYGDREAGVKDMCGNDWYIATNLETRHAPEGLRSVTMFLHTQGTPDFIAFLRAAFGAEEAQVAKSPEGTVLHAKIRIGDSILEMSEAHGPCQPMHSMIHMYVPDADALYEQAIRAGARIVRPMEDAPYGDRIGIVEDPFGFIWCIAKRIKNMAM
ncbi:MAG: VOC family protein [Candidatus Acidiferrales bacterium]